VALSLQAWAQVGGGHGGRVPPTFLDGGDIICHVPLHFLECFVFWVVSKLNVTIVTFCVKSFSS